MTLTELLVATTLLATITAGGLSAFSTAHAARSDAGRLQQLHERAQYVFASLEPELQMAGYFGGSTAPALPSVASIPEPAQRCGANLLHRIDLPLQVLSAWTLPCEARGGGAVAGSDVLVVRRASARTASASQAGRAQWVIPPAHSTSGLLFWNGDAPAEAIAAGRLRELILRVYYVAGAADGDAAMPALRVKSLTSIAGVPAFIDTEVMSGIERMQVELQPEPAVAQAIRVRLHVRDDARPINASSARATVTFSRQFSLRNARS